MSRVLTSTHPGQSIPLTSRPFPWSDPLHSCTSSFWHDQQESVLTEACWTQWINPSLLSLVPNKDIRSTDDVSMDPNCNITKAGEKKSWKKPSPKAIKEKCRAKRGNSGVAITLSEWVTEAEMWLRAQQLGIEWQSIIALYCALKGKLSQEPGGQGSNSSLGCIVIQNRANTDFVPVENHCNWSSR
jgi:hypothetical protein